MFRYRTSVIGRILSARGNKSDKDLSSENVVSKREVRESVWCEKVLPVAVCLMWWIKNELKEGDGKKREGKRATVGCAGMKSRKKGSEAHEWFWLLNMHAAGSLPWPFKLFRNYEKG